MEQDRLTLLPASASTQLQLVAEGEASLSGGSLRLYAMAGQEAVAALDLYAYDPLNRRCAVGIAVASAHRRQGYALATLREAARIATEVYGLHQLYADVPSSNHASRSLFCRAGWQQCGLFRDWLLLGDGYVDAFRFQCLLPPQNGEKS